jgi:hypothetical protein
MKAFKVYSTPNSVAKRRRDNLEKSLKKLGLQFEDDMLLPLYGSINTPQDIHRLGGKYTYNAGSRDEMNHSKEGVLRPGFSVLSVGRTSDKEHINDKAYRISQLRKAFETLLVNPGDKLVEVADNGGKIYKYEDLKNMDVPTDFGEEHVLSGLSLDKDVDWNPNFKLPQEYYDDAYNTFLRPEHPRDEELFKLGLHPKALEHVRKVLKAIGEPEDLKDYLTKPEWRDYMPRLVGQGAKLQKLHAIAKETEDDPEHISDEQLKIFTRKY